MTVYCDNAYCRNYRDGKCKNCFPSGERAISLKTTYLGQIVCTDQEDTEEDSSEE